MKLTKRLHILALLAVVAMTPMAAAQFPPMDMSWAIQQQQQNWAMGQMMAQQAATDYFNQVQAYRAQTGYMGPMPNPVSQSQLQQSIAGMNGAFDAYNQGWAANSQAMDNAAWNHSNTAILGNSLYQVPATGSVYNLDHTYDYYTNGSSIYGVQDPVSLNLPGFTQLEPVTRW